MSFFDWLEDHWKVLSGSVLITTGAIYKVFRYVLKRDNYLSATARRQLQFAETLNALSGRVAAIGQELARISQRLDDSVASHTSCELKHVDALNRIHERIDAILSGEGKRK